jgi:hypothetical protein
MKNLTKMMMWLSAAIIAFTACSKNDEPTPGSSGKAKIENLAITPATNLKYGDVVTLTADLSDEAGLSTYSITVSNAAGENIFDKMQPLTGKTFSLNESVVIPLYPNAAAGDLTLSLTVKNSGSQSTTEDLSIKNVQVPSFPKLYLVLNGAAYEMAKSGNTFTYEDFVPAGATGKIYANADKSGIFWGWENGAVKVLGTGDIPIGRDDEQYFATTFDAVSFKLTLGNPIQWNPMTGEDLYILGTISGHWQDGNIETELAKMKMTATTWNNRKMWTWSPPNTGSGNAADDMWGNTVAGVFLFKKAGVAQYILYSDRQFTIGATNDEDLAFPLLAAGKFNIRVMADASGIISVRAFDNGLQKTVEYQKERVMINGIEALPSISFAGNVMNLAPGNYFVYQNTFELTNGQSVTGEGIDLRNMSSDVDVFTGKGNSTWKVVAPTSNYFVRMDAFSGLTYVREQTGYPKAIYMDGWCWKKFPEDPRANWNTGTELTLYPVGNNKYEATCYVQPWAGDIKFFATPSSTDRLFPGGIIAAKYFTFGAGQAVGPDGNGMNLPVPDSDDGAFYKVSVDLKDGMTTDENSNYVPSGAKFTFSFTPL